MTKSVRPEHAFRIGSGLSGKPFVMSPSFDFAQDIREKPFALSLSKGERFAQPPAQRASGSERTGLSKHERFNVSPFESLRVIGNVDPTQKTVELPLKKS